VEGGLNPNLGGNQRIYDRNDNYITIVNWTGTSPWTTLQDPLSTPRVASVAYNYGTWIALQLGTNNTGLYTYVTTGMVWPNETYSCSSFGTCQYGSGQVVFQSITFPDQVDKKLVFDYSLTNIPLGWGELKRVTVQDKYGSELARKTYTYRWSHGQLPNWENVLMNALVAAELVYKEFDDTGTSADVTENWAYANAGTGSGTVTAPDGSTVVYTGFPIQYSVMPSLFQGRIYRIQNTSTGMTIERKWEENKPQYADGYDGGYNPVVTLEATRISGSGCERRHLGAASAAPAGRRRKRLTTRTAM